MAEGTVKWFDNEKGFGFIEIEGSDDDAFVHYSDIEMDGFATLKEGERVTYELTETEKGPKAVDVSPLESEGSEESEETEDYMDDMGDTEESEGSPSFDFGF